MQMTGRHTPRTPQNLQGTPNNYLGLSSIGFSKREYTYSWYSASGVNYMTWKAKIKEEVTWFDCDKYF
jgi:hypothetical protein